MAPKLQRSDDRGMGQAITENQAHLDAILPAFLTSAAPTGDVGSAYVSLSDFCLSDPMAAGDNAPDARLIEGPAPVAARWAATILPAGSCLRFIGWWLEMWGYGFCGGVYFHLAVETGPLTGARLAFADIDRWIVSGEVARGTKAAALLARANTAETDRSALHDDRRAILRSIVEASQIGPSR